MALTSMFFQTWEKSHFATARWVTDHWELHRRRAVSCRGSLAKLSRRLCQGQKRTWRRCEGVPRRSHRPGRAHVTPECASVAAVGDAPAGHPRHRLAFVKGRHVLVHRVYFLWSFAHLHTCVLTQGLVRAGGSDKSRRGHVFIFQCVDNRFILLRCCDDEAHEPCNHHWHDRHGNNCHSVISVLMMTCEKARYH